MTALVAALFGGVVGALMVYLLFRRAPPQVPPRPVPTLPSSSETGFEFFDRALREAPERFAEARRVEEIRKQMACVVCSEPTAIICPTCQRRVCVRHQGEHPCAPLG